MKDMIERALSTRDKDENIMGMVTFPCNEEEILQRFQVDDLKELYFVDRPDSRMSVDLISRPVKLSVGRDLITYLKERPELGFRIN